MNNFDFITLKLFLEENINFFLGARLQKIQQPTRQELIFGMRNQGQTKKLYVNISPKFFHVCFMSEENEQKRFAEKQKALLQLKKQLKTKKTISPPPMFCMLLRKYIENAKIAKIEQPEGERILEFYFETYNEIGEKIYLCLAIELMGKHSNVILYNYDTNMIIGCAHNVGAEKSSVREIIGGLPYAYPPKKTNKIISGFSQLLKPGEPVSEAIDNYFAPKQEQEKIITVKSKLLTSTKTKLKKIINSLEKINRQAKTQEKTDFYRKKGDLIMANLGIKDSKNKNFCKSIELLDWQTNLPIKIELDETKTLKENANQYYKLYNKSKTANLKTQEMTKILEIEKEYLNQILYSIENVQKMDDLIEIEEEIEIAQNKKTHHNETISESKKYPQKNTIFNKKINDFTIYIGKNNKQNDYIVSKIARTEDLWFHTHNCAGSHVLLRVESGQKITDEIIFECAKLAKYYSSGKDSSKIGVIYTKAKNIKKPPGANLGYVTYKNEKEIIVD